MKILKKGKRLNNLETARELIDCIQKHLLETLKKALIDVPIEKLEYTPSKELNHVAFQLKLKTNIIIITPEYFNSLS